MIGLPAGGDTRNGRRGLQIQDLRRLGVSSIAFAVAKSAMFFVPLVLSVMLDPKSYGEFEFAFAWASTIALSAGLGMSGAVPYFLLKRNRPAYYDTFRLYMTCTGAAAVVSLEI